MLPPATPPGGKPVAPEWMPTLTPGEREFKIFGVRVMDTRNGRTHLREPWKWPFVGALICWPIALGLSQVAIMAIRARDLSETLAAIAGAAVFWVVLPVYTYRMGRTGEDLMGWETQAPEGREEQE